MQLRGVTFHHFTLEKKRKDIFVEYSVNIITGGVN